MFLEILKAMCNPKTWLELVGNVLTMVIACGLVLYAMFLVALF